MDKWYVLYNCELRGGYVTCTIASEGDSTLKLTCNLGARQEIGRYRRIIAPDKSRPLRELLQKTGYGTFPKGPPAAPGTAFVTLGERVGDAPPTVKAFPLRSIPKEIVPFMEAMSPMIEMVREGPQRVLAGSAKWMPPAVPREAELVLQVTLGNPGVEPIEIQNPAGPEDELLVQLNMMQNAPDAEASLFELKPENFRLLPKPGAPAPVKIPQRLEILPGDQVILEIRKRLRMAPGVYKASLVLHSIQGKIDEARAVTGALSIDPGLLTITK